MRLDGLHQMPYLSGCLDHYGKYYPFFIFHSQEPQKCVRQLFAAAFLLNKRLQRNPYKASPNSKAGSGMGGVYFHKPAIMTRYTMSWAYRDVPSAEGKIPTPFIWGKGTLCLKKRTEQPRASI